MTSGILLIDKPQGKTSFHLVSVLRRLTGVKKIGHTGTLDPFATGVMVLLIGKEYTKLSDRFLSEDKEYECTVHLGKETNTYDTEGEVISSSDLIPSLEEVNRTLEVFQGDIMQTPPMFSAKKVQGKKLYDLARKGITIERVASPVRLHTTLLSYEYPYLKLHVACSKGTYIRSLAHDIGAVLKTGAHLSSLKRLRSGSFHLHDCTPLSTLTSENLSSFLRKSV